MYTLYIGSLLIMVRSIFRVVEYLMGNNGFLLRHEYLVYIFDATLMFLVMLLFLWVHPRQLRSSFSSEESSYISGCWRKQQLETEGILSPPNSSGMMDGYLKVVSFVHDIQCFALALDFKYGV